METIYSSIKNLEKSQMSDNLKRWNERKAERKRYKNMMDEKRYFDIDTPERVKKFLTRRGFDPQEINEIMKTPVGFPEIPSRRGMGVRLGLERIMGTNDLLPIFYLNEGLNISKSIARIWIRNSMNQLEGYGTGSMVSPRLLLTNNHVLPDIQTARTSLVEFNFQMNFQGQLEKTEMFALDADIFFFTDEHLDYTIVALQSQNRNGVSSGSFGWNPLIEEEGKAIISQWVSIIQHPNGEPKQIGLRENRIVDLLEEFIHYKTDTSPGSSGSPVYNDQWEIVGLHHSGVPATNKAGNYLTIDGKIWNPAMGEDKIKWISNEGVRISRIIKNLKSKNLSQDQADLFRETTLLPSESSAVKQMTDGVPLQAMKQFTFSRANDGTATWTIPLSVSVQLGANFIANGNNGGITSVVSDRQVHTNGSPDKALNEDEILFKARKEFMENRKDVKKVEWGFKFRNGWITRERCLVVTVLKRKSERELKIESNSRIPQKYGSFDVDIVEPTIQDLVSEYLGEDKLERMLSPVTILRDEIKYINPEGLSLKKIKAKMRVLAHVSPEKGWENLRTFLSSCRKKLTVAMYDFGAPHILDELKLLNKENFEEIMMVMQPGSSVGSGTKKNDLEDEAVLVELHNTFGNKLRNAWVSLGRINGWIASSYHIKVAVADSEKVWASSGSWQSSNQPNLSDAELSSKNQKFLLKNYNRDWHVVIENEELAKTFEGYILHDFNNNKQTLSPDEAALLREVNFVMNEPLMVDPDERSVPVKVFNAFDKQRMFTVTPILTPDNYFDIVLDLIKNANTTLYIQNQTFNAPKDSQEKLLELITAVIEKQKAGVDVKVISRVFIASEARENLTRLAEFGFDVNCIKLDPKCHTKGIMVDGEKVLIGSQNISNDGISVNRDASLLFEDKELTEYFEKIFLHDYAHAVQNIGNESMNIEIVGARDVIPAHRIKFTWSEALEML